MDDEKVPQNRLTANTAYGILKAIAERKIPLNACDINPNAHSVVKLQTTATIQGKESASPSDVAFGRLVLGGIGMEKQSVPVSIKIFLDEDNPSVFGLKYEVLVYRKIMTDIIVNNYSPNFVSYIGYGCCDGKRISAMLTDTHNTRKYTKDKGACILITERVGNGSYFGYEGLFPVTTLHDLFTEISFIEKSKVLFQVIYSLEVLHRYRIMHNDFHAKNILVMRLPHEVRLGFIVGMKAFSFYTRFIPYLFDWDFSYAESLGDNKKITGFANINIKNRFSAKFDLYTLFCYLDMFGDGPVEGTSYAKNPATLMKETDITIPITEEEKDRIEEYQPYSFDQNNDFIYKLSGHQLDEIIGAKLPEGVTNAIFQVISEYDDQAEQFNYFIKLYNPFPCRASTMSANFPTPLEMLRTEFPHLETSEDDILESGTPFVYRLPQPQVSHAVYIDPILQKRGRARISGQPRFPPQKSGYVAK